MILLILCYKVVSHEFNTWTVLQNNDFVTSMQAFVRKVIELHDKYVQYVSECFVNHSLFHKVGEGSLSFVHLHFNE